MQRMLASLIHQRSWRLPVRFTMTAALLITAFVCAMGDRPCHAGDGETKASSTDETSPSTRKPDYETVSLQGRVVWLAEALNRRFGIQTDDDATEAMVALETREGQLYPIVKDTRGRGFHKDERIRNRNVELLVRRFAGSPMIQVIRVYVLHDEKKYEFDYWCDICSIPMFELKECECCQGPIRMRERLHESPTP